MSLAPETFTRKDGCIVTVYKNTTPKQLPYAMIIENSHPFKFVAYGIIACSLVYYIGNWLGPRTLWLTRFLYIAICYAMFDQAKKWHFEIQRYTKLYGSKIIKKNLNIYHWYVVLMEASPNIPNTVSFKLIT